MSHPTRPPVAVAFCSALVRGAARFLPRDQRADWQAERLAELRHRWLFLASAGEWNVPEQLGMIRNAALYAGEALVARTARDGWQTRAQGVLRTPGAALGALTAALTLLFVLTGGLPACRFLIGQTIAGSSKDVLLLWIQPFGDLPHGVPKDVLPSWKKRMGTLSSFARFVSRPAVASGTAHGLAALPAVVTDDEFLSLLGARVLVGRTSSPKTAAIDYDVWVRFFGKDPHVIGRMITIGQRQYPVGAVLQPSFHFLSRQPTVYVADPTAVGERSMVLARLRPGMAANDLVRQLQRASADSDYYFFLFHPRIRSARLNSVLMAPIGIFALCVTATGALIAWACGARPRSVRQTFASGNRAVTLRRAAFSASKVVLGLFLVFAAGLEWARPASSVLLPWSDEGSGPLVSWFYVLGSMGVLFLALADGRARCPVCLRLLAFPVRIGSPGSLFLNWSGTELYCSEGHGILHVPHLFTSWHERKHRWVGLEESWRGLFKEEQEHESSSDH